MTTISTKAFGVASAVVIAIGALCAAIEQPAATTPALDKGEWFVDALDRDAKTNPTRRTEALNRCVRLDRHGKIDLAWAKVCYATL